VTSHGLGVFRRAEFREIDVIKLIWSILEGPHKGATPRGAGLAMDHLFHKGRIEEYFPLHHPLERRRLKKDWYVWFNKPWFVPLHRVRAYFGEKVAMYFSFLGHYTQWLLAPSFIGVIVYVHQRAADDVTVPELPLFAIFIALWATYVVLVLLWLGVDVGCWRTVCRCVCRCAHVLTLRPLYVLAHAFGIAWLRGSVDCSAVVRDSIMLESWKRKQHTHVMMWGMQGTLVGELVALFCCCVAPCPPPPSFVCACWCCLGAC